MLQSGGVVGRASWYGLHDGSGKVTATGRPFDPYAMGVAHKSWPFGTRVRVTVVSTGRSAVVTVLDRTGPAVARHGRFLDLYYGAARDLGITGQGDAVVRAERLDGLAADDDARPGCGPWQYHQRSSRPAVMRSIAYHPYPAFRAVGGHRRHRRET